MEIDEVFFYNQWQNFNLPEIVDCFERISPQETRQLRPGEEYWSNDEPYHLNGKVYGFTKHVVGKEGIKSQHLIAWRLVDERRLESLVKLHGEKVLGIYSKEERASQKRFQRGLN